MLHKYEGAITLLCQFIQLRNPLIVIFKRALKNCPDWPQSHFLASPPKAGGITGEHSQVLESTGTLGMDFLGTLKDYILLRNTLFWNTLCISLRLLP